MDKDKKHVIPRDRYRRRRRVFTEEGQEPIAPYERPPEPEGTADIDNEAEQQDKSAAESRRDSIEESRGRSHEPVYGYNDLTEEEIDESGYQDVYTSGPASDEKTPRAETEAGEASAERIENSAQEDGTAVNGRTREADGAAYAASTTAGAPYNYPGDRKTEEAVDRESVRTAPAAENTPETRDGRDHRSEDAVYYGAVPPGGNSGGGNGRNNRRNRGGGGGFFRSFLLPLLAGLLGALIALLLFNAFDGQDNNTGEALNEEEAGEEQEAEDPAVDDVTENETTAAIDGSRDSVVSVINLQRIDSLLPGIFGEMPEVQQEEPEEAGIGSGVIYRVDGDTAYIVTNQHVVEGAEEIQINMQNGESLNAEIVGTDIWTDLAVLTIPSESVDGTLDFADSDELTVGQTAIAIGSPLGEAFSGSVSQGIVSGLDRSVPVDLDGDGSYDWEANVIQTDAAINPGNSGGALIDSNGNLIGINSMKISMPMVEGIGFAIPANEVQQVVTQIEANGEVQRPFLGVTLQDLYTIPPEIIQSEMNLPEDVNAGVVISSVQPGSPAESAGLQQLDLVTALDGNEVANMMELRQYLYYEKQPGDEMTIDFYRNGEPQSVTVTLQ
ncbi:S1C family serine protease [Salinicoccus kekensis]|uniref:Serine protease HtrA-like n=1 Tax=Salinicoccus kekensis TaxID=714307 RepID=A0A285USH9_9STAP|nr:trypsin-like peptidase domain-containing protein [Salinicoccus kekensis]SOC44875.1 S1-C subfamily serine protease [Salinicoccus kekensis]